MPDVDARACPLTGTIPLSAALQACLRARYQLLPGNVVEGVQPGGVWIQAGMNP